MHSLVRIAQRAGFPRVLRAVNGHIRHFTSSEYGFSRPIANAVAWSGFPRGSSTQILTSVRSYVPNLNEPQRSTFSSESIVRSATQPSPHPTAFDLESYRPTYVDASGRVQEIPLAHKQAINSIPPHDPESSFTPRPKQAVRRVWDENGREIVVTSGPAPGARPQPTDNPPLDCTIVNDEASARRVLKILNSPEVRCRFHACDTETKDIDIKMYSPVGHGRIICASIYVGPDIDFGTGSRIWIDNLDGAEGTIDLFKEYFEDPTIYKVWHNYSFDRHILYNHGINALGFGGDTMHMARLWNAARTFEGGYSLESLTHELCGEVAPKIAMATRFSKANVKKDGTLGKTMTLPPCEVLQRQPETRSEWIEYSAGDAKSTWFLRNRLEEELRRWPWTGDLTMYDFYLRFWLPFGETLTDMEREGIHVRRKDYMRDIAERAAKDKARYEKLFLDWASKQRPEAKYMNPCSEAQKQQFFFAPRTPISVTGPQILAFEAGQSASSNGIDWRSIMEKEKETGADLRTPEDTFKSGLAPTRVFDTPNEYRYVEPGKSRPKKNFSFELGGLGMPVISRTPKGAPQASIPVLKELAGQLDKNPPKYGKAYDFFGGGDAGREACEAIDALCKVSAVEIMMSTFIEPLSILPDENDRVHCSLNLNTETGRLSSRKPNLQNQPALEKDVYKIRHAFAAKPGNKLIVADYGQLELRILAHITKCKSMIEAFKLGGDFHSRTAMGMYPEIAEAVKRGECLLEFDGKPGEKPKAPLLKDMFASERRKAKILNFSIAYGKTAAGLAKDFDVSVKEAKETVNRWYADRPEVLEWQQRTIAEARKTGVTRTLMGRYRPLAGINDNRGAARGHAERAAINTPIQGGAADVVMAGMLKLHRNERLRKIGWKMLLQIHDELIVEGPEETAEEAYQIVVDCMAHPFKQDLLVDLVVDASIADTWYEGK